MDRANAVLSRILLALSLFAGIAGCGEPTRVESDPAPVPPTPAVPTPPVVPPPPAFPPGTQHVPFPALTGAGEIYLGLSFYGGALRSRYVLYDDGKFAYQQANETGVTGGTGAYTRAGTSIVLTWSPELYGNRYRSAGVISGDVLTVDRDGPKSPASDVEDWGDYEVSYHRSPPDGDACSGCWDY